MAAKSSIQKLSPAIRDEVDAAIKRGAAIDEIVWMLKGLGKDVSRSAVGRYSKQYADIASRQRDLASIARAFAGEFGDPDALEGRLLIQIVQNVATRAIMPLAADDEVDLSTKGLMELARAVKDITSASKIDIDREAKIRSQAREKAAKDAEAEGKAAGASPETIDRIKKRILGISG